MVLFFGCSTFNSRYPEKNFFYSWERGCLKISEYFEELGQFSRPTLLSKSANILVFRLKKSVTYKECFSFMCSQYAKSINYRDLASFSEIRLPANSRIIVIDGETTNIPYLDTDQDGKGRLDFFIKNNTALDPGLIIVFQK